MAGLWGDGGQGWIAGKEGDHAGPREPPQGWRSSPRSQDGRLQGGRRGVKGKGKDTGQVDEFWVLSGPWRAWAWLQKVVRSFQPSIRRYLGQWEEQSPLNARADVHLKCQVEERVEEGLRKTPPQGLESWL